MLIKHWDNYQYTEAAFIWLDLAGSVFHFNNRKTAVACGDRRNLLPIGPVK